jgi:hypothetical protein
MKRIVTAIVIFMLLILLSVFETIYITKISDQVISKLDTAVEQYNNGKIDKAKNDIETADKIWEKNTKYLNAFLIHDNTDEVAERIAIAEVTLKYQQQRFPIECASAKDSLKIIIYSMLPQLDNIF